MKKLLFYLLVLLSVNQSFAQIKDGTKVFTVSGNLFNASFGKNTYSDTNSSSSSHGGSIVFSPSITYGKVKNNSLFSYGLHLSLSRSSSDGNKAYYYPLSFGPIVSYQKFYAITQQIYFSPSATLSLGYSYSRDKNATNTYTSNAFASSFYFYPFSLTFSKNQRTNFIINFGSGSIGYNYSESHGINGPYNSKSTSSIFNINANFSGIGVGIQKLF